MNPRLAEEVYEEEIALGSSPKDAAFIANSFLVSPEYRAAWEAAVLAHVHAFVQSI